MHRNNFQFKPQGRKLDQINNRDLEQKLTYQQLLEKNYDLTRENQMLKNYSEKLAIRVSQLHNTFEIKLQNQNADLYSAIHAHPGLRPYENTLTSLIQTYELKIEQFEHGFEDINEEFVLLQKKFEEVCHDNSQLRIKLNEKSKELLEVYRQGSNEKIHSDFGNLILGQINQKQKTLVEQNIFLERQFQKYKSENDRYKMQLHQIKDQNQKNKIQLKDHQLLNRQNQSQLKTLKENIFNFQLRNNELENQKKKIQQAHERAQSQINRITKQKETFQKLLNQARAYFQKKDDFPLENDQTKIIEKLNVKIAFLEAELAPNDANKRFDKLQKELDATIKQKNRYKEALESSKVREQQLNEMNNQHRNKISSLQTQKMSLQLSQNKLKKSLEQLVEKNKTQIAKLRKNLEGELQNMENSFTTKLELKQKSLNELYEELQKTKLQRDKIDKQNQINSKQFPKSGTSKQSERMVQKLRDKLKINQQIYKEQIQMLQTEGSSIRKQVQSYRKQNKQLSDQGRKLKQQLERIRKENLQITQQKNSIVEQIRRVRNEYENTLKEKEKLFENKIKEIKLVVEESEKKKRLDKEKVQETTRQYKRLLEDIRTTYQHRIKELQSQISQGTYTKTVETRFK